MGDHSTEVIAWLCQWKRATGSLDEKERRSHTRKEPSSAAAAGGQEEEEAMRECGRRRHVGAEARHRHRGTGTGPLVQGQVARGRGQGHMEMDRRHVGRGSDRERPPTCARVRGLPR